MAKKKILIADDLDTVGKQAKLRSSLIRKLGSAMAIKLGTDIDFIHVDDPCNSDCPRSPRSEEATQKLLKEFPVPVKILRKSGSPAQEILEAIKATPTPELVVIGTQAIAGIRRLLLGSVAEEVLRHSTRPVMVFGPEAQAQKFALPTGRGLNILVATDLAKSSQPAEQYARSLAKNLGAKTTLLHDVGEQIRIYEKAVYMSGLTPFDISQDIKRIWSNTQKIIDKKSAFFKKIKLDCKVRLSSFEGDLHQLILEEAIHRVDFIIMGTRSRNALLSNSLGGSLREVILHAPIPVIVVR